MDWIISLFPIYSTLSLYQEWARFTANNATENTRNGEFEKLAMACKRCLRSSFLLIGALFAGIAAGLIPPSLSVPGAVICLNFVANFGLVAWIDRTEGSVRTEIKNDSETIIELSSFLRLF